jgi:hypothetical protein
LLLRVGLLVNTKFPAGITLFAATGVLSAASAQEGQRIRIRMGDQTVIAALNDSEAARDLVAMLPLSIRMRDHLGREKTGPLPAPLSERTKGSPTYESGDLGYWRPGGNFVIFYRHDGLTNSPARDRPIGKTRFRCGNIQRSRRD